MNNIVEKIVVVEEQVALIQSKIVPLTSKVDVLNRKIDGFSGLLAEITGETKMIQQEINSFQQELESVRKLLAETKTEGEQIFADQDKNKYLYESMTEMFGEAFQVVSRFFETARKIGIIDMEKASHFLALQQQIAKPELQEPKIAGEIAEPFVETEPKELPDENKTEMISAEPQLERESISEISEQSLFGLPDISALPELSPPVGNIETPVNNTETVETPAESTVEAAILNLPPLQLNIPNNSGNSGNSGQSELSAEEEKKLEDLLADISTPISI
ncbi:MAG: hypothetical protein LBU34_17270 [Planctomycetaceae bacterium]|jgi:regulator of replication initiation timing|nr:hypothetical protein [Planctomycetaceae bacterium]